MHQINRVQWSPVVPIALLIDGVRHTVHLKLEGASPGRSVKDRTAEALLDDLEQHGCLRPRAPSAPPSSAPRPGPGGKPPDMAGSDADD